MDEDKTITIEADDMRRAAALIVHSGRGDHQGLEAILTETLEEQRQLHLVFALLQVHHEAMPIMYTPRGLDIMGAHILDLAGLAHGDDHGDGDDSRGPSEA